MGAFASRDLRSLSEILEFVYVEQNKSVASYWGWHGVGMSMAAKAVANGAKESKLFDVVVLARAGEECSPRKLQTRIAKQLEILHDDDSEEEEQEGSKGDIDKEIGRMIYKSLGGRSFLLIIDNLLQAQGIKLGSMGVPTPQEWDRYKIFITSPCWEVISAMKTDDLTILSAPQLEAPPAAPVRPYIINIGSVDELLEHFRDEAGDVAQAVSNNNAIGGHVRVERDQVFDCFIYLFLLQKQEPDEEELRKYYVGEGLIATQQLVDGQGRNVETTAFKVGEALLGEMVSRFMVERSPDDDGKLSVNSHLREILEKEEGINCLMQRLHIQLEATHVLEDDAKWIGLPNNNKIQTLLLQPYKNPLLSTLLLNDNPQLTQIPDDFFQGLPKLKVLDLSRTPISSLPPSLSCLVDLRLLKLRECSSLSSLPPTLLKDLKQLIILDLHGTSSNIPTEAFEQPMPNLRLVDLSHTNIHSLPSSLLSSLCKLEQLFLTGCRFLVFSLPSLLRQLPALEELDVSGCGALIDVENVCFQDMPKLRAVNLCNTQIARLSFTECQSLEIVRLQGLTNLRSLHLSSVKIKEFPCEISELKCLKQLQLTDVQHLEGVDWRKVDWLPQRLEWDQCGCSTTSALPPSEQAENRGGDEDGASSAFISVSNAKIFRGLAADSPIWENSLSKFHIYICPCWKQNKKKDKEKAAAVDVKRRRMPHVYADIHSKINPFKKEKEEEGGLSRLMEIEGVDRLIHRSSIYTVAAKADVLWLRENGFVKSLSDFGVEREAVALKECRVESCHNIEFLFPMDISTDIVGLKGRFWVSDLGSLRCVYAGYNKFTHLKHLHIECCSKLETLFGDNSYLEKLETLHIRFCARLERVFQGRHSPRGEKAFRGLRILHLWELPKLHHICAGSLLRLEKLRVRACPKLQRLPPLPNNPEGGLKIEGESHWWSNLEWDNRSINKEAINFQSSNANNP